MSTRKRSNVLKPDIAPASDLPPPRKGKATAKHKTTPPFYRTPLDKFIYICCALALLFFAIQVWRLFQLKTAAGGWWSLALGGWRTPAHTGGRPEEGPGRGATGSGGRDGVEERINALAEALGVPSKDIASAIADVVRSHAPMQAASVSSVADAGAATATAGSIFVDQQNARAAEPGMAETFGSMAGLDDPVPLD